MFNTKKVSIDKALYKKLVEVAVHSGYSSVDELIAHVLEKVATRKDANEDQRFAEEQLRGLGYLE
jgi:metal-responsive CopG/Arc/MetJ family transcriptional regulator